MTTAYHEAIEKLQARAASLTGQDGGRLPEKPSIQKQLASGEKQAARGNTSRPSPEKGGKVKNAER